MGCVQGDVRVFYVRSILEWNCVASPVCRGVYLAAVFYHKDSLLVTAEDQIPIVEVDDSYSSSLMQDFLWFTKVPCLRP